MTALDTLNSGLDLTREWMLLTKDGVMLGFWNDKPTHDVVAGLIEAEDEHGPYYLVEAFRREVWDYSRSAGEAYEVNMEVPAEPVTPIQSGPRKVIIR